MNKKIFLIAGIVLFFMQTVFAQGTLPIFNHNVVYQMGYDFQYRGPQNWLGVVQVNDPQTGAPVYSLLPDGVRALYVKYDPAKPSAALFDPTVEVQLFRNDSNTTLEAMLIKKMQNTKVETIDIRGKAWSYAEQRFEQKIATPQGNKSIQFYRKAYGVALNSDLICLIQLTTIQDYFKTDVQAFDASIQGALFSAEMKKKMDPKPTSKSKLKILSYALKDGTVYSRVVVGETNEYYVVKDEKNQDLIINKKDMLSFKIN